MTLQRLLAEEEAKLAALNHQPSEQIKTSRIAAPEIQISTAPFDRGLELAVIDYGVHALAFPCRRILRSWINAELRSGSTCTRPIGGDGLGLALGFWLCR